MKDHDNSSVSFKGKLTLRGMIIGAVGSMVLTMSSLYVALQLGALPWPIIFVTLASTLILSLFKKRTNIHEINITQTAMSAGTMVAGGMAFTLPAIYMLNPDAEVSIFTLFVVVFSGIILGLIFVALLRRFAIEEKQLPYAMGQAAAKTIEVTKEKKKISAKYLFISMGITGVITFLRDGIRKVPEKIFFSSMMEYGSMGGLWLSPMLVAIGYIAGPMYIGMWLLGAIIGDLGILVGGVKLGLWTVELGQNLKYSVGLGMMFGAGIGIIIKGILPRLKDFVGPMIRQENPYEGTIPVRWAPIAMVLLAYVITFTTKMNIMASLTTIFGVWLTVSMSAQIVGQTSINPMEVFGVVVMLAVRAITYISDTQTILIAAIVAIACGFTGNVMNDFKTGYMLQTDPKVQWQGQLIGALTGGFVAVILFTMMIKSYGISAFGDPQIFPAPQARMVATLVQGAPHTFVFFISVIAGVLLYAIDFPVMSMGLGIYLPFYLSLTAGIGGIIDFVLRRVGKKEALEEKGLLIASGMLGGEAVIGVVFGFIRTIFGIGLP